MLVSIGKTEAHDPIHVECDRSYVCEGIVRDDCTKGNHVVVSVGSDRSQCVKTDSTQSFDFVNGIGLEGWETSRAISYPLSSKLSTEQPVRGIWWMKVHLTHPHFS